MIDMITKYIFFFDNLEDTKGVIRNRNRNTDNIMAKRRSTNMQTTIDKTLKKQVFE